MQYYKSPKEEKAELRAQMSAKRDAVALEPGLKAALEKKIFTRLSALACYRFADVLLIYSPIKSEIDVRPLIKTALAAGKKVALPCCSKNGDHTMVFRFITDPDALVPGLYHVPEPTEDCEIYDPENDTRSAVCVTPAITFDREGYRLGYGGGYYDRYLPHFKGMKIGLVFSSLLIERLPRSRHDSRVDVIVTEKEVTLTNVR